jgi:NAD(P)-dependent dehydrogenase (short-subunit alcohol dehydrogenase family)
MAIIVVTGGSSGIGAAAAVQLVRAGHRVQITGRSTEKLDRVYRRMKAENRAGLDLPAPIPADLSALAEVRRLAAALLRLDSPIAALVNNAGVQPSRRQLSADGFELGLAVNHLAQFLLTNLLVARLTSDGARVVTTSSSSHTKGDLDFDDLQMSRGWTASRSYARSKLANILFTVELRRRTRLPVTCFHPGAVSTDLNRDSPYVRLVKPFERLVFGPVERGADTLVWLATEPEGADPHALYYASRAAAPASHLATDAEAARRLWDASVELVGLDQFDARAVER